MMTQTQTDEPQLVDHGPVTEPERLGDDPSRFAFDIAIGILGICLTLPDGEERPWRDVIATEQYRPPTNMRKAAAGFLEDPNWGKALREEMRKTRATGFNFWLRPSYDSVAAEACARAALTRIQKRGY